MNAFPMLARSAALQHEADWCLYRDVVSPRHQAEVALMDGCLAGPNLLVETAPPGAEHLNSARRAVGLSWLRVHSARVSRSRAHLSMLFRLGSQFARHYAHADELERLADEREGEASA